MYIQTKNCISCTFLNNLYSVYLLVKSVVPPMALNLNFYPRASLFFLPKSMMRNQALLFLWINNSPNILVPPKIVHSCQLFVSFLIDELNFNYFCSFYCLSIWIHLVKDILNVNYLCYTCLLLLLALYLILATMKLGFQGHSLNLPVHIYKVICTCNCSV